MRALGILWLAGLLGLYLAIDKELLGCSVISPACGIVVTTPPDNFIVDVSDPVDAATLSASDFTVNGIPADSVSLINGNTTIHFYFGTSPAVQSVNTMHILAGAFDCGGGPVLEFTCTFFYKTAIGRRPRLAPIPPTPTPIPQHCP